MERFINILVIDSDKEIKKQLRKLLSFGGNNLIFCESEKKAWSIIEKKKIGIILLNIQDDQLRGIELLQELRQNPYSKDAYKIVISNSQSTGEKLVKGLKEGAVDYISSPFNTNLVFAKIEVYKTLYFKDLRISQLLENIFPVNVLQDLNYIGKYSPRKVDDGIVVFTDFVAFSKSAKKLNPLELIKELDSYFGKFDEIMERYNLEKIKTIGDSYMALAGVTETNGMPAVRATLAALEIRDYIINKRKIALATNSLYWNIRIGIHSGPLVVGIIGTKKISFDVWGDTVNIASRAEQNSTENNITITENIIKKIEPYFETTYRGKINVKHGGQIDMYFVNRIKTDASLFKEGKLPDRKLRKICGLPEMDYDYARRYILSKLKSLLPEELDYHNIKHTLNVEKAALRIAYLEGVSGEDLILLKTAVLYHDTGFIFKYSDNEDYSIQVATTELPKFGYNEKQIQTVSSIINATKKSVEPKTLLEMIMCDADHDYLGRADYHHVAKTLRNELNNIGRPLTEIEWIDKQIDYLENQHHFYTRTSKNIRGRGKMNRIQELKGLRKKALNGK